LGVLSRFAVADDFFAGDRFLIVLDPYLDTFAMVHTRIDLTSGSAILEGDARDRIEVEPPTAEAEETYALGRYGLFRAEFMHH